MKPLALLLVDDRLNPKLKPIEPKPRFGPLFYAFCAITAGLGLLSVRNVLDVAGVI